MITKDLKKNNEDIALRILYVPYEEEENEIIDVQPEYISKFNFTKKKQVVLLKISDGSGKWHFLALKSELEENSDCMKPTKSFSKLMRNISSNSHENYYCFGCFHSFRCKSTLEKYTLLWKIMTLYEDCIQKLCKELREKATDIFNTEKIPMTPLTPEQKKKHSDSDKCFICPGEFNNNKKSKKES